MNIYGIGHILLYINLKCFRHTRTRSYCWTFYVRYFGQTSVKNYSTTVDIANISNITDRPELRALALNRAII
jgi:hypothetical protein